MDFQSKASDAIIKMETEQAKYVSNALRADTTLLQAGRSFFPWPEEVTMRYLCPRYSDGNNERRTQNEDAIPIQTLLH